MCGAILAEEAAQRLELRSGREAETGRIAFSSQRRAGKGPGILRISPSGSSRLFRTVASFGMPLDDRNYPYPACPDRPLILFKRKPEAANDLGFPCMP
jgi:hypothetical protein